MRQIFNKIPRNHYLFYLASLLKCDGFFGGDKINPGRENIILYDFKIYMTKIT